MVNKLILGTVQLGLDYGINNQTGKPTLSKAFEILHTAHDNGIEILDTAEAYGNSMEVIGKFHREYPNKKFKLISKLHADLDLSQINLFEHVKESCNVLETDKLYGYMFHSYKSFKKNVSHYNELIRLKSNGLVSQLGISLYTNDEIFDIVENYTDFDFIQIPFNLLDNDSKRKASILRAKEKNMDIHTRSTFLQGLFFKDPNKLDNKFSDLKPYLLKIDEIRSSRDLATETLALQYALQKDYVDHVLIGVEKAEQLIDNLNQCKNRVSIPHKKIDEIDVLESKLLNPSNWN